MLSLPNRWHLHAQILRQFPFVADIETIKQFKLEQLRKLVHFCTLVIPRL